MSIAAYQGVCPTCLHDHNEPVIATGDHAELARLADMADWMAEGDPGANGSVLLSASVAAEHAADLKALLAENAALRAECGGMVEEVSRSQARLHAATEAERKLAEAEARLERWEPKPFCSPSVSSGISKEAERG